jgi:cytochrome b561
MDPPTAVPMRLENIHWLVALAVISAILLSFANVRLKTLRVEPLAMKASPWGNQGQGLTSL